PRAGRAPPFCFLPGPAGPPNPQTRRRAAPPPPARPPFKLRVDARASAAGQRRICLRALVDPGSAAVAVDPEARQIDRGLEPRRLRDLVFERCEHGGAAPPRCGRYERRLGLPNFGGEHARAALSARKRAT